MLRLDIPEIEVWDEERSEFFYTPGYKGLELEHSLVSISKWEGKWQKPFLTAKQKTPEETTDYVRCMALDPNVNLSALSLLSPETLALVNAYITTPQTAVLLPSSGSNRTTEKITSELIYYWMITAGIPFECETWHFSRLMALLQVCGRKSGGGKKMKKNDIYAQNAALNAMRRKQLGTRG